jgi:5'-deoxynucleotidase YfbR-like HD superfamily hydrolase
MEYDKNECTGDWIQTYSGKKFHVINPTVDEVDIGDIAHALSNICRWTGHCKEFYSVAQHCVLVSNMLPPELALWGLLHDATEAYIGDMNRPLKLSEGMGRYREVESLVMSVIAKKYGLDEVMPQLVKEVDNRMLQTEAEYLLSTRVDNWKIAEPYDFSINAVHPRVAKAMYLETFNRLMGANNGKV